MRLLLFAHDDIPDVRGVFEEALPPLGFDVTVVRRLRPGECGGAPGVIDYNYEARPDFGARPSFRRAVRKLRGYLAKAGLARRLEGRPAPAIVQAQNYVFDALVARRLARSRGARFVYQLTFPYYDPPGGPPPVGLRERLRARAIALLAPVHRRLMRQADLVLAISDGMARALTAQGLVPPERIVVQPSGVGDRFLGADQDREAARSKLSLGPGPLLLYHGTQDPRRRLEILVEVLGRLAAGRREVRLLLLGRADPSLVARFAAAGLGPRAIFAGHVPHDDVPRYLAAADVSVSPIPPVPAYEISSPLKTVEAMALGRPVVGSDIPDHRFLLGERGERGIVVPHRADDFAGAIARLLDDPAEARAMGLAARGFVATHRHVRVLAGALAAAYGRLLAAPATEGRRG